MTTGKYLVLDVGWIFPTQHLVETLKEVRQILGKNPISGHYLIFKVKNDRIVQIYLNGKEK